MSFYMTLRIETPHKAVRLKIPVMKTRKPPSPTTQSRLTITKAATDLSTARKTIETTVVEMDLSSINLKNSKSKIKEYTLSSNNLDKALHDAHLLNTLQKPTNKDKKPKSNKELKHVHFSPIIFVKLVIPDGKKVIHSNIRLVRALANSGSSKSILTKSKAEKLTVKNINQEQQW